MPDPQLDPEVREGFVEPSGEAFRRLVEVMATLRAECPWDKEQTHQSLARHLLEETYEALEAIDNNDSVNLREELGDLALQVVFHSNIAFEQGDFTIADVLSDLREKLIRRHPHVFGEVIADNADDVRANWDRIKKTEKPDAANGPMDGIPRELPALSRAAKVWTRGRRLGFLRDEDAGATLEKLAEEVAELTDELSVDKPDAARVEAEIGDVLFIVAAVAQRNGIDAESALRRMLARGEARFAAVQLAAAQDGRTLESLSDEQWRGYWDQAKREHP